MKRFLFFALFLCPLIIATPSQAQRSNQGALYEQAWQNTWADFEYWVKRLDTSSLVVNWEKRRGERWIRVYVDRERWNNEAESNRDFLKRALNTNTRWPVVFQDADYKILAFEGLTSAPQP
jgi:hypothetical protein